MTVHMTMRMTTTMDIATTTLTITRTPMITVITITVTPMTRSAGIIAPRANTPRP